MSLLQIKSMPLLHSSLRGSQTAFTPNAGVLVVDIDPDAVLVSVLVEEEDVGADVVDVVGEVVGDDVGDTVNDAVAVDVDADVNVAVVVVIVVDVSDVTVAVKVVPVSVVVVEVAEVVDVELHPPAKEACDSSVHDLHFWSAVKVAGTAIYSP